MNDQKCIILWYYLKQLLMYNDFFCNFENLKNSFANEIPIKYLHNFFPNMYIAQWFSRTLKR